MMMSHTHIHQSASESLWISSALILATLIYLRGLLRLHKHEHGKVEGWRATSFVFGLLFIWFATVSPLAQLDHELLTAHMVQHLLLMTLAPPLIFLGLPRKALPYGPPHPVLCWLSAAGALVVWHIPPVFILGMRSQMWHGIEQACFLATGLLFWWPVVRPWPRDSKWSEPSILLYLFLATLPCDILSGFLVFCDRVVYPVFLSSPRPFGLSALEDQQCAGALMWTCVTIVYLIAGTIFTMHLLSPHRSHQSQELARSEEVAIPQLDSRRIAAPHNVEMEVI
jgi:putative membrane protein